MLRQPTRSTRTGTLCPYATRFRSRSGPSGRLPLATRRSSAAAIWSEKRLNRVTYLAYLGSKASTRALSQLGQREKPCTAFAPQGRTIWRAPARRPPPPPSGAIFAPFPPCANTAHHRESDG